MLAWPVSERRSGTLTPISLPPSPRSIAGCEPRFRQAGGKSAKSGETEELCRIPARSVILPQPKAAKSGEPSRRCCGMYQELDGGLHEEIHCSFDSCARRAVGPGDGGRSGAHLQGATRSGLLLVRMVRRRERRRSLGAGHDCTDHWRRCRCGSHLRARGCRRCRLGDNRLGAKQSGFIGGGQVGYNWQAASWVYGAEADIQGLTRDVNGSVATVTSGVPGFPSEAFTSTTSVTKSLDYFGTLRARFGYLLTPGFLVYGTAGLAYGGVHATTSISQADAGILGGPPVVGYGSSASISQTRAGWTAGGGVEMQLGPRWTAKAEYLYYDLGSVSYGLPNLVGNAPPFAVPTWVASAQSTANSTATSSGWV